MEFKILDILEKKRYKRFVFGVIRYVRLVSVEVINRDEEDMMGDIENFIFVRRRLRRKRIYGEFIFCFFFSF